jgi:hypothetical protein
MQPEELEIAKSPFLTFRLVFNLLALHMAQKVEVHFIKHTAGSNPHARIQSIGGIDRSGLHWHRELQQVILDIELGTFSYWFRAGGKAVQIVLASKESGEKYLKAEENGENQAALMNLPDDLP